MTFDFINIIYGLITALILFFSKSIYRGIKGIFSKGTPMVSINYECKWRSAYGTNPRNYKFESKLTIQNIDILPIYDIQIYLIDDNNKSKIKSEDFLAKNSKIEDNKEVIIQYGDARNMQEKAKEQLPSAIKNPTILVEYKNKKGKKFKIKKSFK